MVIIVDGPNNVGKTTFINKFLEKHPEFYVEHNDDSTPNDFEYWSNQLAVKYDVIYDRSYIDERLYSNLHHRDCKLLYADELVLREYNDIVVVFVDADYNFIAKACSNKGESFDFVYSATEREYFKEYIEELRTKCSVLELHNHLGVDYKDGRDCLTVLQALEKIIERYRYVDKGV